jgi:hypothetical protein
MRNQRAGREDAVFFTLRAQRNNVALRLRRASVVPRVRPGDDVANIATGLQEAGFAVASRTDPWRREVFVCNRIR